MCIRDRYIIAGFHWNSPVTRRLFNLTLSLCLHVTFLVKTERTYILYGLVASIETLCKSSIQHIASIYKFISAYAIQAALIVVSSDRRHYKYT